MPDGKKGTLFASQSTPAIQSEYSRINPAGRVARTDRENHGSRRNDSDSAHSYAKAVKVIHLARLCGCGCVGWDKRTTPLRAIPLSGVITDGRVNRSESSAGPPESRSYLRHAASDSRVSIECVVSGGMRRVSSGHRILVGRRCLYVGYPAVGWKAFRQITIHWMVRLSHPTRLIPRPAILIL